MSSWFVVAMALLTVAVLRYSRARFLRLAAVALIVGNLIFAILAVQNASRAAMISDHALMERRVTYIEAYRAGLDAAHSIVMHNVVQLLASTLLLAILALVPRSS